jgi:hypothetical protein
MIEAFMQLVYGLLSILVTCVRSVGYNVQFVGVSVSVLGEWVSVCLCYYFWWVSFGLANVSKLSVVSVICICSLRELCQWFSTSGFMAWCYAQSCLIYFYVQYYNEYII